MKRVSLAVCGIFLLLVSTSIVSGTTNLAKAQSLGGGVNGQGDIEGSLSCLSGPSSGLINIGISFSASTGPTGSINGGEFSIIGTIDAAGNTFIPWSGSINGGTFSTTSYQLTGVHIRAAIQCLPLPGFPNVGDPVIISGNCGDNVPIQFSSSNGVITGTFRGNVQCTVPVTDTTPPVITVPSEISVPATSLGGAVVTYTVTATDANDGQVTLICVPPSGSTFPVGSTSVTCTATDAAGNVAAPLVFTVTVTPQPIPTPPPDTDCSVPPSGVITGTESSDRLTGTNGNDIMLGLGGNDRMDGLGGNDRMNGCDGNDSVNGNTGNDGITGGIGNDAVSGGDGDDNVQGGEGNDIVSGDGGTNTLTGGLGSDRFICGPNGDTVTDFQPGQDMLIGPCMLASAPSSSATSNPSSNATPSTLISTPTS